MTSGTILNIAGCIVGLVIVMVIFSIDYRRRMSGMLAFYGTRRILYKDWIALYGERARPTIKSFLRCFGDSFTVPANIIHKLGPGDGVMDFYRRYYSPGEPDDCEDVTFAESLKETFGYVATEKDGALTMSQLFEKVTGIEKRSQNGHESV